MYVSVYLSEPLGPMDTTKTYGADGNKFKQTDQDAIERFWRHLLAAKRTRRICKVGRALIDNPFLRVRVGPADRLCGWWRVCRNDLALRVSPTYTS